MGLGVKVIAKLLKPIAQEYGVSLFLAGEKIRFVGDRAMSAPIINDFLGRYPWIRATMLTGNGGHNGMQGNQERAAKAEMT